MNVRTRHFCFTSFGDLDFMESLKTDKTRYLAYGVETCPTTQRMHYQAYISFVHAKTLSAAIKYLKPCHVEVMRGTYADNEVYCSKEGSLVEWGEKPVDSKTQAQDQKAKWQLVLDLAKQGKIEEIDPTYQIRYYSTLKAIKAEYAIKPPPLEEVTGLWIYGPAGVGKSRYVFDTWPDHYIKSRNKWWQGYTGQEVVCLDDLGLDDAKWMGSFLKDWGGQYPFQAETKGSSMQIRPKQFIVTSQYRIEDLWADMETQAALNRRFKKLRMDDNWSA